MENLSSVLRDKIINDRYSSDIKEWIDSELFYIECNEDAASDLYSKLQSGKKFNNKCNSSLAYALGITDIKPDRPIDQTPISLPDVDYDSNARDKIKEYLVTKYGKEKIALIGTYNALKTKGAIKDVCRQLRPDWDFKRVNDITKRFDAFNRADYKTEIEYFEDATATDQELAEFFAKNSDVKEQVVMFLGNYKSSGIHAGGIIASSIDISELIPLHYDEDSGLYVTQYEMKYVEMAGLIKYDFLGVNTLNDVAKTFNLIKLNKNIDLKLRDIPLNDKEIFKLFTLGKTESVFQFNTDLATDILKKLFKVESITDLAMITSIARPGPLNMGMDKRFIARKNGTEKIEFLHPKLETILSETYGIYIFQESIMKTVQEIGELTGDESVTVLKGLGKKDFAKIEKYKNKFIRGAIKNGISEKIANDIYDLMASFAEYGFNKSHATAYAMLGYVCMWLKTYYPLEWKTAVLSNSTSDDFKELYPKWEKSISKPDINLSKTEYFIDYKSEKAVMAFTAIKGIAEKGAAKIVQLQPFDSFEDFLQRADGINKTIVKNLILSGAFDSFNDSGLNNWDFRKRLFELQFCYNHEVKPLSAEEMDNGVTLESRKLKPSKAFLEDLDEMRQVTKKDKRDLLIEELSLLSFSTFDYYEYFGSKLTNFVKRTFPKDTLITPKEALELEDGRYVLTLGSVEEVNFFTIKKEGKNFGKEMCKIKIGHKGSSIEVTIFPDEVERDKKEKNVYKNLKPLYPLLVKGKINVYNDNIGIVAYEAKVLVDKD